MINVTLHSYETVQKKNILQKQTPQAKEAQLTTTLKRKDSS